jgi:hypothetical protein
MAKIFGSSDFDIVGSGLSGGGDEIEYSVFSHPKTPAHPIHFDFSLWDSFLQSKESYTNTGSGGSDGLYWRQNWSNNRRFIVVDAVVMKNGDVKTTYREILK